MGKKYISNWKVQLGVATLLFLGFFFVGGVAHAAAAAACPTGGNNLVSGTIVSVLQDNCSMQSLWKLLINVINSFVIVIMMFVAFCEILRIDVNTYGMKKILPTLILAVVAANFSWIIVRVLVDTANVLMTFFTEKIQVTTAGTDVGAVKSVSAIDPLGASRGAININFGSTCTSADPTCTSFFGAVVKMVFTFAGAIALYILAFLMFIRNWVVYLLAIVSGAAFMAMAFPASKNLFNQWWKQLIQWIYMPVVSVGLLWFAGKVIAYLGGSTSFMALAFALAAVYGAVTIPFKMGGAIAGQWGKLGSKAWGLTGGNAWKATGGAAGAAIGKGAGDFYARQKTGIGNTMLQTRAGKAYTQWNATRALKNKAPGMLREKIFKDAEINSADRLARNPRTSDALRKRYVSLIRSWVRDEKGQFENTPLQSLLGKLDFNTDGTLVTPENNKGTYKKDFTEEMGQQMARIEQIKSLLRRPNTLLPAEKTIASAIIAGSAVSAGGGIHVLQFKKRDGSTVNDIRQIDPSGFGISGPGGEPISAQVDEEGIANGAVGLQGDALIRHLQTDPRARGLSPAQQQDLAQKIDNINTAVTEILDEKLDAIRIAFNRLKNSPAKGDRAIAQLDSDYQMGLDALRSGKIDTAVRLASRFTGAPQGEIDQGNIQQIYDKIGYGVNHFKANPGAFMPQQEWQQYEGMVRGNVNHPVYQDARVEHVVNNTVQNIASTSGLNSMSISKVVDDTGQMERLADKLGDLTRKIDQIKTGNSAAKAPEYPPAYVADKIKALAGENAHQTLSGFLNNPENLKRFGKMMSSAVTKGVTEAPLRPPLQPPTTKKP